MTITREMKMADLVHLNHLLIPVINRFGIDLGFGDSTVGQICGKKNINLDFFLEIANAYHDDEYFPQQHLQSFSVGLITDYLKMTHQFYVKTKIPEIEALVDEMVKKCYPRQSNIEMINKFFDEYKIELLNHIQREDDVVFPYALEVEEAFLQKGLPGPLRDKMEKYSMDDFKKEHDNLEEKLYDLINIIIKYLPAPKDNYLCSKVITGLSYLENDLNNHARIEDKVMIPKVIKMEKFLKKQQTTA